MSTAHPTVVVVGTGSIGRRHLTNLVAMGAAPQVCSEHRPRPALEVAGQALPVLAGFEAALAGDADVVLLANPSSLHAGYARRALEAGKHVLIEKPVALDADDLAPLLAAAAERPDQVVGVVQQLRFHPLVEHLRRAVRGHGVGQVVAVEAHQGEHVADYHPDEDFRTGYAARAELGGGVLRTQNHLLDLCVDLLGLPDAVSAVVRSPGALDLDVEDAATFVGTVGDVDLSGRVDFLARPRRFRIDVVGDEGRASGDYYRSTFEIVGRDEEQLVGESAAFDRDAMFRAVIDDFFEAVRTGRAPRCGLDDAARTVRLIDAIRSAGATGRRVVLG